MAIPNKTRHGRHGITFQVDPHPGRPPIEHILGPAEFPEHGKRYVSPTAAQDYEPTTRGCKPTDAQPGSIEKILVLRERVAKHQPLWHPDDYVGYDKKFQRVLFLLLIVCQF